MTRNVRLAFDFQLPPSRKVTTFNFQAMPTLTIAPHDTQIAFDADHSLMRKSQTKCCETTKLRIANATTTTSTSILLLVEHFSNRASRQATCATSHHPIPTNQQSQHDEALSIAALHSSDQRTKSFTIISTPATSCNESPSSHELFLPLPFPFD